MALKNIENGFERGFLPARTGKALGKSMSGPLWGLESADQVEGSSLKTEWGINKQVIMTTLQREYRSVLDDVAGKNWKKDKVGMPGNAGIAIVLSVLQDGRIEINHLKSRLPDFSQTDIRVALRNLRRSEFLMADPLNSLVREKGKKISDSQRVYRLSLGPDEDLKDPITWALMAAVANGWLERSNQNNAK